MNKDFISVTPDSGGGNGSLSVTAQANTTPNTRNISVVISGSGITKTISVSQPGKPISEILKFTGNDGPVMVGLNSDVYNNLAAFVEDENGLKTNLELTSGNMVSAICNSDTQYSVYLNEIANSCTHVTVQGTFGLAMFAVTDMDILCNVLADTGAVENVRFGFYRPSTFPALFWQSIYQNYLSMLEHIGQSADKLQKTVNLTIQQNTDGSYLTTDMQNGLLNIVSQHSYLTLKFIGA